MGSAAVGVLSYRSSSLLFLISELASCLLRPSLKRNMHQISAQLMTAWWNQSISRRPGRAPATNQKMTVESVASKSIGWDSWNKKESPFLTKAQWMYVCRINIHHTQPAALPPTINNAINEHSHESTRSTILSAHHAFLTTRDYKWPNTPYNSASFSRCPSLAWLPAYFALAIKISVMEHINYTHPATAVITISHVWMDYSYLQPKEINKKRQRDECRNVFGQRTADVGDAAARRLTALALKQCAIIACKWTRICILTHLH